VHLAALFQTVLAAISSPHVPPPDPLATLSPRHKAAAVVVSGLPAPRGAAGVLVRRLGFGGVAITDSLSVVRGRWPVRWARQAAWAGADLLLFTSATDARRAIRALVPLARKGVLDEHVRRVLELRRSLGLTARPRW
jgi:hypothetical protein